MITKSKISSDHVSDLRKIFENARANNMRLNPAKCSFGLTAGKFLGFLVTQKGIEADPAQKKAILEMENPRSVKDLQKLTGCIATLRRFIPQSSKRCLPFFSAMKKASKSPYFEWNDDCEKNFAELKTFLANPSILTRPLVGEPLRVYLSASDETVAAVLVRVDEGKDVPEREIHVLTNQPLKRILHKPDITGRLATWTIELSQFYIEHKPRTTIKAQVLSDFIAGCQFKSRAQKTGDDQSRPWLLFVDGSSTSNSGGAGIILISPEGFKIQQALKFGFSAINNVAEYEALIAGLKLASGLEAEVIDIFGDSQLFEKALLDLKVQYVKASVAYPQANGLAEVTNRTILQGLKKRNEEIPRCWVDELPNVLWSYRTTSRNAIGETPFCLAYGVDAVLPVEVSLTSPRVEVFDPILSLKGLCIHNDLLEETWEEARMRMVAQQEKTTRYFNKKVKPKGLKVDDLVLRDSATSQPTISGKFKPTREGPYRVSKVISTGTCVLSHLDGRPIKNAWNGIHLKKFFQ
ncbi:uncharacterized protein LOC141665268 [Apium graveolens]|uniref:uncharacterized protein LOC141665268 n=1 Tax=Apium graveolens TaxID=4045 RepID=UPI003D7BFD23